MLRLLKILIILTVPILLVLGSVRLVATDQYLAFEYSKASFPADPYGFDRAQRTAYATATLRYVVDTQTLDAIAGLGLGDRPLYNERELKHLQDVQSVYQKSLRLWHIALGLALLAGAVLAWRAEARQTLGAALQWGGLLTAGLITVTGILAVIGWRVWFTTFHQVFFASGTWTFRYTDALIRLFPERFWFDAALTISGLSLISGLLIAVASRRWQMKH